MPSFVRIIQGWIGAMHLIGQHVTQGGSRQTFVRFRAILVTLAFTLLGCMVLLTAEAFGLPVSMLVAVDAQPGGNPSGQGEVLRFQFTGTGSLTPLSSIPTSLLQGPNTVAVSPQGELFVSSHQAGSISRFIFDAAGNFTSNGVITGNQLNSVHGMAFSPWGELFVIADINSGPISRFLFDSQGNVSANGTIPTGDNPGNSNVGLAFSPSGELFFTQGPTIKRFKFDPQGMAIPNGSFGAGGNPHYLDFNAQGELFIPTGDGLVRRFKFDSAGNPIANGTISVSGFTIGVAFSSSGELFVSEHLTGGISRFLFDADGNAIPHGFVATPHLADIAIFEFELTQELASLAPSTLWIGLKNSDDQGTQFDVRTELYINNNAPVSVGITRCITGVTRNPNNAKEVGVPFGAITNGTLEPGDSLSLKVLTRIGTNPDNSKCPGHNNTVGLRLYYDAVSRASRFGAQITPDPLTNFFLHTNALLDDSTPTATTAQFKDSASVNFAGGNPWKEIGTWIMILP